MKSNNYLKADFYNVEVFNAEGNTLDCAYQAEAFEDLEFTYNGYGKFVKFTSLYPEPALFNVKGWILLSNLYNAFRYSF